MIAPRLLLCSGAKVADNDPRRDGRRVIELDALGPEPNVHICLEDVANVFLNYLSPRLIDLIEIASYVYTADCATRRGTEWTEENSIEPWGREFRFVIPVRDVDFWQDQKVIDQLKKTLSFLSSDIYDFDFVPSDTKGPPQQYLQLGSLEDWPFYGVDRVLMFSGGLDSLAGAVQTASRGEKLLLVSHRPVNTIGKRQRDLYAKLRQLFPNNDMHHIHVQINKTEFDRESTQRTRSFLFSALGTVVAGSVNAKGVSFFENGIVSLNLPLADEALRSRASRTTHPQSLWLLEKFLRMVTERQDFVIDNPFIDKTKTDVVSIIASNGAAELIPYSCSCAHASRFQSKTRWHCGACSQCIDRRVAIIAAGQADNDPETDYVIDVFTGERNEGAEQNIAVGYVRHVYELNNMSDDMMSNRFNLEFSRAAVPFANKREIVEKFIDTHKRHATIAWNTITKQVTNNAENLISGQLHEKSMVNLIVGRKHLLPSWVRFADRVSDILSDGLPVACKTQKPENEPLLQEICDGILRGSDEKLKREYPMVRWSSVLTKPDWSSNLINLWIELKYVRTKKDINPISEAISSDITKYGDNGRNTLYVVYDPSHLITDEAEFSKEIEARQNMMVRFIR